MSAPNVGYFAVKYFGATPGVLIGGAAGGLASSTAVTITNARRAAAREGSARLLAAGVGVASAVMFIRVAQSLHYCGQCASILRAGEPLLALRLSP
jgi:uncharacterized membrane protein (DUF4010 family)